MERKQVYWDDVKVGQEIPGYTLKIDWTRQVKQVSGSQDFYAVHHDPDFARAAGHPQPFVNTGFMQGCFSRLMTDWVGDEGFVRKFRMEMRKMNFVPNDKTGTPGDTMSMKGRVTDKYIKDGEHYVEADVWAENEREGVTTPSKCTLILPVRG
ncbi:MAG: hypothetical protein HW402_1321 [Dehalococcoidales bacterium]|nr:hypothetical protein [Dehalococcoidales bacterium]